MGVPPYRSLGHAVDEGGGSIDAGNQWKREL